MSLVKVPHDICVLTGSFYVVITQPLRDITPDFSLRKSDKHIWCSHLGRIVSRRPFYGEGVWVSQAINSTIIRPGCGAGSGGLPAPLTALQARRILWTAATMWAYEGVMGSLHSLHMARMYPAPNTRVICVFLQDFCQTDRGAWL